MSAQIADLRLYALMSLRPSVPALLCLRSYVLGLFVCALCRKRTFHDISGYANISLKIYGRLKLKSRPTVINFVNSPIILMNISDRLEIAECRVATFFFVFSVNRQHAHRFLT